MTDALFLADVVGKNPGDIVDVSGAEGRHAVTVKRLRMGESILLADGAGTGVQAEVVDIGKAEFSARVTQVFEKQPAKIKWTAVQGLAKGPRSDIAIEALTELGVDEVIAWQATRSVVRWEKKAEKGLAKWAATLREASKQCRRFDIPELSYANSKEVAQRVSSAACSLILHEDAETPLSQIELPAAGEIVFIIGPEGGISPQEAADFEQAGAKMVSLGDYVLRTSTAGLVALSQLQLLSQIQTEA